MIFVASQLAFIFLGLLPLKMWKSFSIRAKDSINANPV